MSSGKTPGMDGIPAEFYKAASPVALDPFYGILSCVWEEETMPHDFRGATVVSFYKNKGNKSDCGNYWGISLLSTAGKILARVILNNLVSAVSEESLPESQCGFRAGRSTIDMVFSVRQVQEKCIEQRMDLYAVFVDLTKAFDMVNREALWVILSKVGCPRKFTHIIRLFNDGMVGLVLAGVTPLPPLRYRMASNRAVSLPQSCSTCSSPAFWTMPSRSRQRHPHQVQIEWLSLRPTPAQGQDQNSWETRDRGTVCWRLYLNGAHRSKPSAHCQQVCGSLPALRLDNQSWKDRGPLPTFTRLHEQCMIPLTSLSETLLKKQLSFLSTLAVSSPVTAHLTGKSLPESARPARLSVISALAWTTKVSSYLRKSNCTKRSSSQVFSMAVKRGNFTGNTSSSLSVSTWEPYGRSWASNGKTNWPTSKFWIERAWPALKPWSWKRSFDGLATSSAWSPSDCLANCSMENWGKVRGLGAAPKSDSKTVLKTTWSTVAPLQQSWKTLHRIDQLGAHWRDRPRKSLRPTAVIIPCQRQTKA